MSNKPLVSLDGGGIQVIVDALAHIVRDPGYGYNGKQHREQAFRGLIKAGAVHELAAIAVDQKMPDKLRRQAIERLTEIAVAGSDMELSQTEVEGILKVHSQTTRLSTR